MKTSKILYDARHIGNIYSGLGRYTFSILNALIKNGKFKSLEILLDSNFEYSKNPFFQSLTKNTNVKFTFLDAPLYKVKHHIIVSNYVNKSDCDIYFYPHWDAPMFVKNKDVIYVIHDLLPIVIDNYILKFKNLKRFYFKILSKKNIIKTNYNCIAVSKSTRKDIHKYISPKPHNKIKVVYEDGLDFKMENKSFNTEVAKLITLKYLFYIGDRRPHKNLIKMIDIFRVLKQKYHYEGYFVIAGNDKNFDVDINQYTKDDKFIKLIGKVSDSELDILYSNMQSLFFISKYEGFGLPIIEAAKKNKRIITSNNSSCGEIAPPSALLIDNEWDNNYITELFAKYLTEKNQINNDNYLKDFSWDKSVGEIFKIKQNI